MSKVFETVTAMLSYEKKMLGGLNPLTLVCDQNVY